MNYITEDYSLPIPALSIHLGLPGESPWLGPLMAVVDTGADMTMLPVSVIRRMKGRPFEKGRLLSQWGEVHPVSFYLVEMEVDGIRLVGVQVAADEVTDEVILGRNVLNYLSILLDGPEKRVEILDDATIKRLRSRRKGNSSIR